MSTALDDLCLEFARSVIHGLARLLERDVPVKIVCTGRTDAQHALNVTKGTSKTSHSKHVPATNSACPICSGTLSHAIDIVPWEIFTSAPGGDKALWMEGKSRDEILAHPSWGAIVEVGRAAGFRLGADWHDPFDPGHWETPPS